MRRCAYRREICLWIFFFGYIIVDNAVFSLDNNEEAFLEWLRANGAQFNSVDLVTMEYYGRGLVSNRQIKKGSLVLSIPEKLILSMENLDNMTREQKERGLPPSSDVALYEILRSSPEKLSPTDAIALFLVGARCQPHSRWAPYIAVLPRNFTTTIYWSEDDLNWLQSSSLRTFTQQRKKRIAEVWSKYAPYLQKHPNFFPPLFFTAERSALSSHNKTHFDYTELSGQVTVDERLIPTKDLRGPSGLLEFKWALSVVWSRVFALKPGKAHGGLVPLADMMNAAPPTQTSADFHVRVERENGTFHYIANVDIEKGTQIFAPYGVRKRLSNAQFLLDYGFVWPFNPHDVVVFHFEIPLTDPYYDKKVELLERARLFRDDYNVYVNEYPRDLIAAIRISCLSAVDLEDPQLIAAAIEKEKVHATNERFALMTLLGLAQKLLAEYPTSIEEDARLLNSHSLTYNQRAAVIVRKSEKEILMDLINRLANILEEEQRNHVQHPKTS
jgi:hypothetical protein